jgi:quercetin dioxygenase-like cupin family protein
MPVIKGEPSVRSDLFGGRGEVRVWSLLEGRAPPFTAALSCELEAGGHVGRHVQQHYPEIVIGLEGRGEARIGGDARVGGTPHALEPGSLVYLPLGEVLEIRNLETDQPLRYLIIKATR